MRFKKCNILSLVAAIKLPDFPGSLAGKEFFLINPHK
jgi:hypothetical protein